MNDSEPSILHQALLERLSHLPDPHHAVDLRCRTGGLALHLAQLHPSCQVTGIDAWSDGIRLASQAAKVAGVHDRVTFDRNDKRTIPLADGSVDLVVGVAALAESTLPQGLLKEIDRVLMPGGHVVLAEWMLDTRDGPPPPNLPRLLNQETPAPPEKTFRAWVAASALSDNSRWEVQEGSPHLVLALTLHKPMSFAGHS